MDTLSYMRKQSMKQNTGRHGFNQFPSYSARSVSRKLESILKNVAFLLSKSQTYETQSR